MTGDKMMGDEDKDLKKMRKNTRRWKKEVIQKILIGMVEDLSWKKIRTKDEKI